ncbi:MAG: C40 family peptidase [Chitinophagaceae bacterium]|nr:C40 family peptidase [Chitinophagaceae bacterium]
MDYAVVAVPAAPVRRKANHRRELVSQLLFGEMVKILRSKGPLWVKVQSLHDHYEGWMTRNLLREISDPGKMTRTEYTSSGLLSPIHINGGIMHIPYGSSLPGFANGRGSLQGMEYGFTGSYVKPAEQKPGAEKVVELTTPWLNAPYLWGGRTILGVDCSGFVQVNFKMMGIDLPRDAWQQAQIGSTVKKLKDGVCGDLVFFDDRDEIVHVGILLNNTQLIHASGRVRIDEIDKKGIINGDTGKRTHSLESIKRYW